jgi:hypothetical protein
LWIVVVFLFVPFLLVIVLSLSFFVLRLLINHLQAFLFFTASD